jgi:chromosomal replication initiator protein
LLQMEKRWSGKDIWMRTLGRLQIQFPRETFNTWLKDAHLISEEDGLFVIGVPDAYTQKWLQNRLHRQIHRTLREVANREVKIRYVVSTPEGRPADTSPPEKMPLWSGNSIPGAGREPDMAQFRSFVVGECNRLAYAASLSVVEHVTRNHTASPYNPLVIYGGTGVGKSHLLRAMHRYASSSGLRSACVTVEEFTNQFLLSLRHQATEEFRSRYRGLEMLLLDDIQFLAGKESTQEEFFHTLNALESAGAQVVVAGDRHPNEIPGISERLRSRLNSGLPVEIGPPGVEMKKRLLENWASEKGLDLEPAVLNLIAERVLGSVWEVQGAFNRTAAYMEFLREPVTPEILDQVLSPFAGPRSPVYMKPETVLETVASFYEIPQAEMEGKSRKRPVVQARHMAIYILREDLGLGLEQIGRMLGGRNHTTVRYAYRKISAEVEKDPAVRRHLGDIRSALRISENREAEPSLAMPWPNAVAEAEAIMAGPSRAPEASTVKETG